LGEVARGQHMSERGRPKILQDGEILYAALTAFAEQGYEGVSMRTLSRDLGLSHSAIGQRFATKDNLYRQSIHAEFDRFFEALGRARSHWPESLDDIDELKALIHSFLMASIEFPALGQLMNREGAEPSERLDFIVTTVIRPQIAPLLGLLERLRASNQIRPVSTRTLFFLVAHGAEAPFTLRAFSATFDETDGPLDPVAHVDETTELIMRAITA